MKRIQINDKEYSIKLTYGTGKSVHNVTIKDDGDGLGKMQLRGTRDVESTTCTVLVGKIGTKDDEKIVLVEKTVKRNHKDKPNHKYARKVAIEGALSSLPRETRKEIWGTLQLSF